MNYIKDEKIEVGEYISYHKKRKAIQPIKNNKKCNIVALIFTIAVISLSFIISAFSFGSARQYTSRYFKNPYYASAVEKKEPYKSMVVIDANSGEILNSFNENDKLPEASLTKIMTAIVAIEHITNLEQVVTVPYQAVGIEGTSIYLRKEEQISLIDLLYGLMLASGNDCATALAITLAGSQKKFVEMMNNKAKELGLINTLFKNPHGLEAEDHYTSAYDLAKLTAYALKNETFLKIVSTKRYNINKTNKTTDVRYLKNKQKLMFDDNLTNQGIVISGVKSGFTPEAGRCLVTSASNSELDIITVVLNCPEMFEESEKLIKNALNNYTKVNILKAYDYISTINVYNSNQKSVGIYNESAFNVICKKSDINKYKVVYDYKDSISAPLGQGSVVGSAKVIDTTTNTVIFESKIKTTEDIISNNYGYYFNKVIKEFV